MSINGHICCTMQGAETIDGIEHSLLLLPKDNAHLTTMPGDYQLYDTFKDGQMRQNIYDIYTGQGNRMGIELAPHSLNKLVRKKL